MKQYPPRTHKKHKKLTFEKGIGTAYHLSVPHLVKLNAAPKEIHYPRREIKGLIATI